MCSLRALIKCKPGREIPLLQAPPTPSPYPKHDTLPFLDQPWDEWKEENKTLFCFLWDHKPQTRGRFYLRPMIRRRDLNQEIFIVCKTTLLCKNAIVCVLLDPNKSNPIQCQMLWESCWHFCLSKSGFFAF